MANLAGIGKQSYAYKLQWINNNMDKLATLNNVDPYLWDWDLINLSDEPLQFIAIAKLIYKFHANGSKPIQTNQPVLLDATCSGIQHISTMILNDDLATAVNVLPSNNPQDLYTHLIDLIIDKINTDDTYIIYRNIKITRKM